jgi:hypothetical protein
MSTQLILYPQNHKGYSSGVSSGSSNEFVVNGNTFTGMNSAASITGPATITDILNTQPAIIVNTWYRSRENAAVNYPTASTALSVLHFYSILGTTYDCTVYQRLDNLTIGMNYTLTVDVSPNPTGIFSLWAINGSTNALYDGSLGGASLGTIVLNFTAETTQDIIFVAFGEDSGNTTSVKSISIKESVEPIIGDGQVICDLYAEEDIPLTLSIDDFKNVAEKVQSYSKDFNLPATKRNNQIFNNMFEVTRADDNGLIFNPYVKTKCVLKQDGFILFEGYLRLINIKDKEGQISYNVNLYSEVIALADVLKNSKFSELDFTELAHNYDIDAITGSWENGTNEGLPLNVPLPLTSFAYDATSGVNHTQVLKYPFIDWNHQFIVGGTGNSAATVGNPELTTLQSAFRPCIQLKYLINRIFSAAGFTFTSNFFDSADFENLFMDFNWGDSDTASSIDTTGTGEYKFYNTTPYNPALLVWSAIELTSNNFAAEFGYDTPTTNIFTCPAGQVNTTYNFNYYARFRCYSITQKNVDISLRWLHTPLGGTPITIDPHTETMQSTAQATVLMDAFGQPLSITVIDGGYYTSPPTVILWPGTTGALASISVTMAGNTVAAISVSGGNGYQVFNTEVLFASPTYDPTFTYAGSMSAILNPGDTLALEMVATEANAIRQAPGNSSYSFLSAQITGSVSMTGIASNILLQTLRGELGQWDFLKGIFTMFNLISMVDESNPDNILIEPYSDVFINNISGGPGNLTLKGRGIQHDWTDKVDVSEMELNPLTDLNVETIFQFVEDEDDYCFNIFKQAQSGHLYGSKVLSASGFTILQGTDEIIAEPFAATVCKPLMEDLAVFIVPSIYARNSDGTWEGFDNSPRILYNNGIKGTGADYFIPAQNGGAAYSETGFLQFSHFTTVPTVSSTTKDFVFESSQLPIDVGVPPIDNLYSTYWAPYFNELYNANTRIMTLRVNLSPSDVAAFNFYDMVFIKNRIFRVNKIEYKPNSLAKVEFILIG